VEAIEFEYVDHIGDEDMSPEGVEPDESRVEKVRQLLLLTDLVERYPLVVARRVTGLVYVIIAGGVSFATLLLMSLQDAIGPGDSLLVNLGFIVLSLVFSWGVAFRLVLPLTSSYPQERSTQEAGRATFAVWGILAVAMVVLSFVTLSSGMANLFPPVLQLIMGFGFLSNYVLGRRRVAPEFYTHEHVYFAAIILLSIVPMIILPSFAYMLLIVADVGGIYMIGIYLLITAERLLLQSQGPG